MSYYKQILKGDVLEIRYADNKTTQIYTVVDKKLSEKDIVGRPHLCEIISIMAKNGDIIDIQTDNELFQIIKRTRRPSDIINGCEVFADIEIVGEFGWIQSLYGLSQNKNQPLSGMTALAKKLAWAGEGHSKFLESIFIWFQVVAPRYMWQEMDTYRISTKQSQSTMFKTSFKLGIDRNDFEHCVDDEYVSKMNELALKREFLVKLKQELKEGYLQQRVWCMSYKTLQNLVKQRKNHTLPHWHIFCDRVRESCQHPEYIFQEEEKEVV